MKKHIILVVFGLLLGSFFCATCFAALNPPEEKSHLITLSDGIGIILNDSRLVKIALSGQDMAAADSLMARSALLPQINASFTQVFQKDQPAAKIDGIVAPTSQRNFVSYGFDVYQTVFDFGKSLSLYGASKELLNAQKTNVESVKRLAILEFIVSYYDVLETQKMIAVVEKEVLSLASYLRDIEHLYEQGVVVKNDLLPAKVKFADAQQRLIVAKNARVVAGARLCNILSLPLRDKIEVRDTTVPALDIADTQNAWEEAQVRRPEITFLAQEIKASSLTEKSKAVSNYLTVYADGGYAFTANKYQVHEGNSFLNLGAKLPLFDGGLNKADAKKEHRRQEQFSTQKEKLIEDIKFEIEDSFLGLKNAREREEVAGGALTEARENVRVNRVKYAEGIATATDVLEAIALQTGAETNHTRAVYEVKRGSAKLMYSMGIDLASVYGTIKDNEHGSEK